MDYQQTANPVGDKLLVIPFYDGDAVPKQPDNQQTSPVQNPGYPYNQYYNQYPAYGFTPYGISMVGL